MWTSSPRWLPPRAARRLGGALGRAGGLLRPARQRYAVAGLEQAFPGLDAAERAALARRASARRVADAAESAALARLAGAQLCRRLQLEGWSHFDAVQAEGRRALVVGPRLGLWRLALIALGLFRGPLTVIGSAWQDPLLRQWSQRLERRHGSSVLRGQARMAPEKVEAALGGGLVAGRIDPSSTGELALPFLGRLQNFEACLPRAALASRSAILPIFGGRKGSSYRLRIGAPILPEEETAEELLRLCLERIEREIRQDPELWPWDVL